MYLAMLSLNFISRNTGALQAIFLNEKGFIESDKGKNYGSKPIMVTPVPCQDWWGMSM